EPKAPGDARVRASLCHQREHLALATSQRLERVVDLPRYHELLNESRVDNRAAAADTFHRVEEVVEVGDTTLEHVSAPAAACKQRHRMGDLDVCREDQDRRARKLPADDAGGLEALGRMSRRHSDIDDREIRLMLANEPHELGSVPGLPDDFVARLLQQACDALTHQDVVVSDDHSCATRFRRPGHREKYATDAERRYPLAESGT